MKKMKEPLFSENGIDHGLVTLNYAGTPEKEFTWYGEAFHKAGKELVDQLKKDQHFGEWGFPPDAFKAVPIVFLYRQALELYLKGVVRIGSDLLRWRGQPPVDLETVFQKHDLQPLFQHVDRILSVAEMSWDLGSDSFRTRAQFQNMIRELDEIDAKSFAFRYPTRPDGTTASLGSHFRFNLFSFCDRLDPIFPALEGTAYLLWEIVDDERRWADEGHSDED